MPKIPTYVAGDLASSRTGTPSMEKAGQIVGEGIVEAASRVYNYASQLNEKSKQLKNNAELAKTMSAFEGDMMVQEEQIRTKYQDDPDAALPVLQQMRNNLFQQHKNGLTSPDTKLQFEATGVRTKTLSSAQDKIWAFQQGTKKAQQDYYDENEQSIAMLNRTDDMSVLFRNLITFDKASAGRVEAFGPKEAMRFDKTAKAGRVKSWVYGQIDRGRAFSVLRMLNWDQLSNVIGAEEVKSLRDTVKRVVKADKQHAAMKTLADHVDLNFSYVDGALSGEISFSQQQETIAAEEFRLAKVKAMIEEGDTDMEPMARTLTKQLEFYNLVKEATIERKEEQVIVDPDVEARLLSQFDTLIMEEKGVQTTNGTFQALHQFQVDLEKNRYNITPNNYKRWRLLAQTAFMNDLAVKDDYRVKEDKGFFGTGLGAKGERIQKEKVLSSSKPLREAMRTVLQSAKVGEDKKFAFEALKYFMDELTMPRIDGSLGRDLRDPAVLSSLGPTEISAAQRRGVQRAWLKKNGYPDDLDKGSTIKLDNGRIFTIEGFDDNGAALIQIGE